ncbi:PEGA domain-containing protein [bacterium]|nr:PEGA domain-containing protein [candidate division CSSED10-310 bacterium]
MRRFTNTIAVSLVFLILSGCASTTLINTEPSNAEIWIDGINMGYTPYSHTDTDLSFSTKTVQLKKGGFQDATHVIKRDQMNVQNTVLSFLCFWPGLLWSWEYPASYTFSLVKNTADLYDMNFESEFEYVALSN